MDKGFNILRVGNVVAGRADIKTWAGKIRQLPETMLKAKCTHLKVVPWPKSFNTNVVLVNDIIRFDFRERCMLIDTSMKFGIQHLLTD